MGGGSKILKGIARRMSHASTGSRAGGAGGGARSESSFGSTMSRDEQGGHPKLMKYIQKQKWKKIRERMKKDSKADDIRQALEASCYDLANVLSGSEAEQSTRKLEMEAYENLDDEERDISYMTASYESVFHVLCRQHPPEDIVDSFANLFPPILQALDSNGRTPLHIAVAYGASSKVIRCLLKLYPHAASKQDAEGKTPLHLACEFCPLDEICDPGFDDGDKEYCKGPFLSVIVALFAAAPRSINVEDNEGCNPLELTIITGGELKVVKLIQKLSMYQWKRERKEAWKRKTYEVADHVIYAWYALLYVKGKFEEYDEEVPWEEQNPDASSASEGSNDSADYFGGYNFRGSEGSGSDDSDKIKDGYIIGEGHEKENGGGNADDDESCKSDETIGSDVNDGFQLPKRVSEFLPRPIWEHPKRK
jgi:hypothetical protein